MYSHLERIKNLLRLPETELGTLSIEAFNKKCKISTVKACLQAHVFFHAYTLCKSEVYA